MAATALVRHHTCMTQVAAAVVVHVEFASAVVLVAVPVAMVLS